MIRRNIPALQRVRAADVRGLRPLAKGLGIVSALILNIAIWAVIAAFVTVGLAAADVSASTFYVTWAFFAAVMVGGAFLTIKWGKEGRRWLWRISLSWTFLFMITLVTLGLALVLLGLLSLHPGFRRFLSSCLVPPPPRTSAAASGAGSRANSARTCQS